MIRRMGQFDIVQRTSDGKFDASNLLKQWNNKGGQQKKVVSFLGLEQTKTFIDELERDTVSHSEKTYDGGFQPVDTIKGRNTKNGKTPDVIWDISRRLTN